MIISEGPMPLRLTVFEKKNLTENVNFRPELRPLGSRQNFSVKM